jgi:hypothetical protein
MEDAIQFKSEFEAWKEDVEFSIDGVFSVEVEFEVWVKSGEGLRQPDFEFGDAGSFCFVGIMPCAGAGFRAEVVFCSFDLALYFYKWRIALFAN